MRLEKEEERGNTNKLKSKIKNCFPCFFFERAQTKIDYFTKFCKNRQAEL